jgi:endonuclease/exonuclease/phosphatase family metal-dependent hydrolase
VNQPKASRKLWTPDRRLLVPDHRLRLLSYNIQVGIETGHYGHHVSRAWRHALPGQNMHHTLDRIAELIRDYDFVAIQEADAGSLRTRFINQLDYLAQRAGFAYRGHTVTRDLRPVAQHSLGYLSRFRPSREEAFALPGQIPGRRAMRITLGAEAGGLTLLVTHLSLSRGSRHRQLEFLSELIPQKRPAVLMGDLNADVETLRRHGGLQRIGLWVPPTPPTFPSWRPRRSLDHILMSPDIEVHQVMALPHAISDHLPVAADISVPGEQK